MPASHLRRALALVIAVLAACGVVGAQKPDELQLGLRLNSEYSMQWSGGRLYLEGRSHDILDTMAKRIHNVWPGSTRGSYSIAFDDSVGLLLGDRIVPAGPMFGEGAILRSGRYELICAATVTKQKDGTAQTRFVEFRTVTLRRELVVLATAIRDFDVDSSSRILYLTEAGKVFLLANTPPGAEVPLPSTFTSKPERVFLDATSSEVVVYGGAQVARLALDSGKWTLWPFDVKRQALVRHAASGRVRPEERFR